MARRRDAWIALALVAGFLVLYLRTLCPTVYLGDVGDFCTAIFTGGVPHPPGYPLFGLLGRLALLLIPVGEPAFRIGCVVATAGALAVAVIYLVAREMEIRPAPSLAGVLVFGLGYSYWSQCTRVEVHSLHLLLVALVLLCALRYRRHGGARDLYLLALAGSLDLAHHLTIVLWLPAVLLLIATRLRQDLRVPQALRLAALLVIGPLCYALLFLWARQEPPHSWGHPDTLPLLGNHATARLYSGELRLPGAAPLLARLQEAGRLYHGNFPYLLTLFPLLGLGSLWRRSRGLAGALVVGLLAVAGFNLSYQIRDISSYYLTLWLLLALLLAEGMDALLRLAPPRLQARAPYLALLLGAVLLLRNGTACDLHRATWVRELACQRLQSLPPNGILISGGPDDTFPLWYAQHVLHVRPDVLAIDHYEVANNAWRYDRDPSRWYLRQLARRGLSAPLPALDQPEVRRDVARGRWLQEAIARSYRPVATTFPLDDAALDAIAPDLFPWLREQFESVPVGLVLQLCPRTRPIQLAQVIRSSEACWEGIRLPNLVGVRSDEELTPDYVAKQYAYMRCSMGHLYRLAGRQQEARAIREEIARWNPRFLGFARGLGG